MPDGQNVGGIYAQLDLDNKGFTRVLGQSKTDMAKAALEMQKSSRIKFDLAEWKRLSSQMQAIRARASEVRTALIRTTGSGPEVKKLEAEYGNLQKKLRLLKAETEPARKEMERLTRATKEASAASKAGFGQGASKAALDALKSQGGPGAGIAGIAGLAMSDPYVAAGAAAEGAVAGVAIAAIAASKATGEYAEKMKNLAAQTQMSTSRLQELKFVSEANGLDFDKMTRAIDMVEKKLEQVKTGKGPAAAAFAELGVKVTDAQGHLRSMNDLFPEILKGLQGMSNGTERNAVAAQIFGRGWAELAPILQMSAQQFDALTQKAHDVGAVMSGESLEAADKFRKQMNEVHEVIGGITRSIGAALAPTLADWAKKLEDAWPKIKEAIASWWAQVKPVLVEFWQTLTQIWDIIKAVLAIFVGAQMTETLAALKLLKLAFEAIEIVLKAIKRVLDPIISSFKWIAEHAARIWAAWGGTPAAAGTPASAAAAGGSLGAPVSGAASDTGEIPYLAGKGEDQATLLSTLQDLSTKKLTEPLQAWQTALQETLDKQRAWAAQMADAMKGFASDALNTIRDQINKERELRNKALEDAKSRYEKEGELGRAGMAAVTNYNPFGKQEEAKELTASDITQDRVQAAAAAVAAARQNQAAIQSAVQSQLFGNSIGQYESVSKAPNAPETASLQTAVEYLAKMVHNQDREIREIQKLTAIPVHS